MDRIVVLDFGGQYTDLIESRYRKMGFFVETYDSSTRVEELGEMKGLILSGGPDSVYSVTAPEYDERIFQLGIPILGICYGAQLIAKESGGDVVGGDGSEYGVRTIQIESTDSLLAGLETGDNILVSHGDTIRSLGEGYELLARTDDGVIASFCHSELHYYAVQFHPEVTHTPKGEIVLNNFANICKASMDWDDKSFIEMATERIKREVGDNYVISLFSGGGDSLFSTYIARLALGDKVIPVCIDNGLMRRGEQERIRQRIKNLLGEVKYLDESSRFFDQLVGVIEPEKKRDIIGSAFLDCLEPVIAELDLPPETKVIQGTLLTDLVESGMTGRRTAKIKMHHNVNSKKALEFRAQNRFVEPNDKLNKDDLRRFAAAIGLSEEMFKRDPFPGPGMGVRVVGSDGTYEQEEYEAARRTAETCAEKFGYKGYASPVMTVGVGGDDRTYHPLLLFDGEKDFDRISKLIASATSEGGNRGVYILRHEDEISSDYFKTVTPLCVDNQSAEIAREMDVIANSVLDGYPDARAVISQMPVPIFACNGKPWVGIRPVKTEDYRTATPPTPDEMPWSFLDEFADAAMSTGMVGGVVYDPSHKPPATIEWE